MDRKDEEEKLKKIDEDKTWPESLMDERYDDDKGEPMSKEEMKDIKKTIEERD